MDVNRCTNVIIRYANYTVCASVFIHFCMQRKNNESIPITVAFFENNGNRGPSRRILYPRPERSAGASSNWIVRLSVHSSVCP